MQNFRLSFSGYQGCEGELQRLQILDFIFVWISRLRGFQGLQDFVLYHFQDIKVARVAKVEKFQSIIFWISRLRGWIAKVANFRLYHCLDIKVARVPRAARFRTLSFPGY